jgi:hypothetical protein
MSGSAVRGGVEIPKIVRWLPADRQVVSRYARLQRELKASGPGLNTVFSDGKVTVATNNAINQAVGKQVGDSYEAADDYMRSVMKFQDPAPLAKPVNVVVLTQDEFAKLLGVTDASGIAGVTINPNTFVMPQEAALRLNADDKDTQAHQDTHVANFRVSGKNIDKIPIYVQEGVAYLIGDGYSLPMKNPVIPKIATFLGQIKQADAQWVVDHFRKGSDEANAGNKGFLGEVGGALFVEFLRAKIDRPDVPQKGFPNAMQQFAKIYAAIGKGQDYDQAFQQQFKMAPAQAEAGFVKFIGDTEGKPQDRLGGTLYGDALGFPRA